MKRNLLSILMVLTLFVGFSSCDKDDDPTLSLTGTSWEKIEDGVSVKLTFQTNINCQIIISGSETTSGYISDYSYEYEHPNVRMYPKKSGSAELKGIIDNKTMNIINISTGKNAYTLTKL